MQWQPVKEDFIQRLKEKKPTYSLLAYCFFHSWSLYVVVRNSCIFLLLEINIINGKLFNERLLQLKKTTKINGMHRPSEIA